MTSSANSANDLFVLFVARRAFALFVNIMTYPLYIIFALAPSIIWLLFYLRKDRHPDSNKMVLKVFFLGILAAGLTALLEIGAFKITRILFQPSIFLTIFNLFLIIALLEELFKYLAVKNFVLSHSELDEPIDIMLYLIISALGFAALENLLVLSPIGKTFDFSESLTLSFSRFIGATFLHTLASGALGFFLALSFYFQKNQKKLFLLGLFVAIALHGLYNFAIMEMGRIWDSLIPLMILIGLAVFTTWGFRKLKKLTSVCMVK